VTESEDDLKADGGAIPVAAVVDTTDGGPDGGPDGGAGVLGTADDRIRQFLLEPVGIVGAFVSRVASQVRASVQPEVVQAVAETFTFPLALMLAVLLFLVIQHRLDRRDPKLRNDTATGAEIVIHFVDEQDVP
jgi:hypothetical protein